MTLYRELDLFRIDLCISIAKRFEKDFELSSSRRQPLRLSDALCRVEYLLEETQFAMRRL